MMAGPIESKKKKRQKLFSSHHDGGGGGSHKQSSSCSNKEGGQTQEEQHQRALALSQQLRQLSTQKRLQECLDLYYSSPITDVHHGSIVVDCCARCGNVYEAECVVIGMLTLSHHHDDTVLEGQKQQRHKNQSGTTSGEYFWKDYQAMSHYRRVPIQAWTALLKAYAHSGLMAKADSLFTYLISFVGAVIAGNNSKERGGGNTTTTRNESREIRVIIKIILLQMFER